MSRSILWEFFPFDTERSCLQKVHKISNVLYKREMDLKSD